ncbi:hypothetical protein ACIGD1_11365 [Streptomyces sp. NPDC085612]|uniref:hypothetical protein n=1 Tax=Streptomyces sp. NPDC085612 TaxID=3365732 RepID=UPI0037D969FA
MTPADQLRDASAKLRTLTAAAEADVDTNPYWRSELSTRPDWYANGVRNGLGGEAGELAAAMHPGVGAALAGLLTAATRLATAYPEMAHDHDRPACDDYTCDLMGAALAVAREILGQPDRNQT